MTAVEYNRARPYDESLWRDIQELVGASVDGNPGPETAGKVTDWQRDHALSPDGCVGPITLERMQLGPVRFVTNGSTKVAFCWVGKMAIDADGAPNAYNEPDTGIDFLANAGQSGNWWGLAVNAAGQPIVQGPRDPAPNHYVSTTALVDGSYPSHDPRRYVDSSRIEYVAIPRNFNDLLPRSLHLGKGDMAVVWKRDHHDAPVFAIFADVAPRVTLSSRGRVGEGSIRLAQAIGHDPYVLKSGRWRAANGISSRVVYLMMPGSKRTIPHQSSEVQAIGAAALDSAGGEILIQHARAILLDNF